MASETIWAFILGKPSKLTSIQSSLEISCFFQGGCCSACMFVDTEH